MIENVGVQQQIQQFRQENQNLKTYQKTNYFYYGQR